MMLPAPPTLLPRNKRRQTRVVRGICVLAFCTALALNCCSSVFLTAAVVEPFPAEVSLRGADAEAQTRGVGAVGKVLALGTAVSVVAGGLAFAKKKGLAVDVQLLVYFAMWYLGNYYYNISNKRALQAAGGVSGFPLTIATLQLGVGCVYATFLWAAPDARKLPRITMDDMVKMMPVAFTSAGAHASSVFALGAGAVSFGQIVKAAEPAFAALVGILFYEQRVSTAKWICLIPVIGGVVLASLAELDFAWSALATASLANVFAAVRANENKKLMGTDGLKDRMGSVGNQYAITTFSAFLFCIPVMLLMEGTRLPYFFAVVLPRPDVWTNLVFSGFWFYMYNELATMTLKKTSAVTQSVANTAKRVIVIVGVAIVMGESLSPLKLFGCAVGIGGVFVYSVVDDLRAKARARTTR